MIPFVSAKRSGDFGYKAIVTFLAWPQSPALNDGPFLCKVVDRATCALGVTAVSRVT
jgi:hypothetical protein